MANEEQLAILRQGVEAWNAWGKANWFTRLDLVGADLGGADLQRAVLVDTRLTNANLTGCHIYGLSAWDLNLEGATQKDLIITKEGEPEVTVDNLEVAQFVYLLLHNEKIRDAIDAVTTKAVLILGRFPPSAKRCSRPCARSCGSMAACRCCSTSGSRAARQPWRRSRR